MMPIKSLNIVVVGDKDTVSNLRLAGVNRYYTIETGTDTRENVRKTINTLLNDPSVGIIVIPEDYMQYVEDILTRVIDSKTMTPVIMEVPSKYGTIYEDVIGYYKSYIRKAIGFDIEL